MKNAIRAAIVIKTVFKNFAAISSFLDLISLSLGCFVFGFFAFKSCPQLGQKLLVFETIFLHFVHNM